MIPSRNRWMPLGAKRQFRPVEVGEMIGVDLVAWRVLSVDNTFGERQSDYRAILERVYGPEREYERDLKAAFEVGSQHMLWVYPNDRIPLCSCCGHPFPCHMQLSENEAANARRRLEVLESRIHPGCCYACGEPITQKQLSIEMPEDNVDIPGAPPPVFHLRNSCRAERTSYLERRNKAYPDVTPITEDTIHQEGTT